MNIDDMEGLDEETREEVEELWEGISKKYEGKELAAAQYKLGKILRDNKFLESALAIFDDIEEKDDTIWYTKAQTDKALINYFFGHKEKSLSILNAIKESDDLNSYIVAKYSIGFIAKAEGRIEDSIEAWSNVKRLKDYKYSAEFKFSIAKHLIDDAAGEYKEARDYFVRTLEYYPYESYCYIKICDLLASVDLKAVGKKYLKLIECVLEIVSILKLDFKEDFKEEKNPERKLAHYTNTNVTNLMLEKNKDKKLPSFFRLNTINNVNDPSEGHLLVSYLKEIKDSFFHAPEFDRNLHAFIGCFTFNHDSLNQFRLYGKEADKEASGVSLVFNKDFFQTDSVTKGLSFLSFGNDLQFLNYNVSSEKKTDSESSEDRDISVRIGRKPVMRCVYIDPNSDYLHLAQRNRITFFREFGDERIKVGRLNKNKAEIEWKKYKEDIDKKTKRFGKSFSSLKKIYQSIMKERIRKDNINSDLLASTNSLADEIVLPLKYLIKHSAFQEEQECRIIYVTSLKTPEVKMVNENFLFVEYEAKVKENLDKVYIAPAAKDYQLYLAWLLRDQDIKIELSNNPYRHT